MTDRIENWRKFSKHMEEYIRDRTVKKYEVKDSKGFDLATITATRPEIFIWNILRYALRMWNGRKKPHDIEKIAHYAEMTWTAGNEIDSDDLKTG